MKTKLAALGLAVLLGGCALQQDALPVDAAAPRHWTTADNAPAGPISDTWWQAFKDPDLDRIVQAALVGSSDIAAANARIRQAQAYARYSGAPLLPSVDLNADAQRQIGIGGKDAFTGTVFTAGLAASYEVDFWGKNRSTYEGALARMRASVYARDTTRITVAAGAANLWLQTVGLKERLAIAGRNRDNAAQVLALVEAQVRAGSAGPLDLARQRGLLAGQDRAIASLAEEVRDSENSLAVLVGAHLGDIAPAVATLQHVSIPAIGAGIPSSLLTRRPDIAGAEATLAAANADVTVARAQMLPSLTLSAGLGVGSDKLHTLFDNPVYDVAAALAAPIFDHGRLAAARDVTLAQREELLANYHSTITAAFGDVEAALNAMSGLDRQIEAQQRELDEAQTAFRLADARYRSGAETLLTVLDAQRTLFAAEDLRAQLRQARLQACVAMYRAMGGGWKSSA